ncbi:MAG TPA: hypothetical protein VIM44_06220 [Rariglobus sp.]
MISQSTCMLIAMLLTACGVWMRWKMHGYRICAEEAMKDGKLTYAQASRRLFVILSVSRALTVIGMALLIACLLMPAR